MELRHLITFRTIVDAGGFRKAADELGYAQSSVTGHMKDLEGELGKPLFDRLGKSITLTQAGKNFLPYALDIIELYSKSKDVVNSEDDVAGQLTIGASESIMVYYLPQLIMGFQEKYPQVEIKVKSVNYEHLTAQLKKGDIDLAMLVEQPNWNVSDLTIKQWKEEKLTFVQSTKAVSNSEQVTMLVTEYLCSWRPLMDEYIRKQTSKSFSKIELPSIEAIKKCVQCGLGSSMLPNFVVENEIISGDLQRLELENIDESLGIFTAMHKDKWLSANIEEFLRFI